MDILLAVLFYLYLILFLSAPLLTIPAVLICRKLSNHWWKGLIVLIPLLGLPVFAFLITWPKGHSH